MTHRAFARPAGLGLAVPFVLVFFAGLAPASAADAASAAAAGPWADFWAALQGPLAAFATAVLSALGMVVTWYARRWFGDRGALAANQIYQIGVDQAAGWLKARMAASGVEMTALGDPENALVKEAAGYLRDSYPEAAAVEPSGAKMAKDIVAALGRLIAAGKR